jgi:hypothetical protein
MFLCNLAPDILAMKEAPVYVPEVCHWGSDINIRRWIFDSILNDKAWKQMMHDIYMKLNLGLLWQKYHSTTRRFSPTVILVLCDDGFMDFIHRPKSKILKILKN